MKEELLKKKIKLIEWHRIETDFTMPASQGYLIQGLLETYFIGKGKKPRVVAVGWNMDIVAIKTPRQIMVWKDIGIGARFLGLVNYLDKTVELPKDDIKPTEIEIITFSTYGELIKEIEKRDYNNIRCLRAKITKERYYDTLEVLPPLMMNDNSFVLSEALTDNLYLKFVRNGNGYQCEVVMIEDEELEPIERRIDISKKFCNSSKIAGEQK